MKKLHEFFRKKYMWTLVLSVILCLSTAYTLVDALVLPKSYVVVPQKTNIAYTSNTQTSNTVTKSGDTTLNENSDETASGDQDKTATTGSETSDYSYKDENINININKYDENGVVFYVADVQLSDISYLKTAFANNTYGKNITQTTSEMAEENNAIFAVNGDYYGFRDTGLIIRNSVLYRDNARSSPDNQALTINSKGELEIVSEDEVSGSKLVDQGILQSFSFGPTLVQDGKAVSTDYTRVSQSSNPRTAIGQISPLHYIFIVVDGRSSESKGMTLSELANEFVERGATVAYNLDGGGSSSMWLNGNLINNPTDGRHDGERSISDIIYIGK